MLQRSALKSFVLCMGPPRVIPKESASRREAFLAWVPRQPPGQHNSFIAFSPPPIASLHQSDHHTGPSSKLDCLQMPLRWSEGTWSSSAKFTVTPSPTSSGSSMLKRTAVNTGPMDCLTSRSWRWELSGAQGAYSEGSLGVSARFFDFLLDFRDWSLYGLVSRVC